MAANPVQGKASDHLRGTSENSGRTLSDAMSLLPTKGLLGQALFNIHRVANLPGREQRRGEDAQGQRLITAGTPNRFSRA